VEVSPMTALRQRMLEDLLNRNLAPATVRCYVGAVAEFAQYFNKPADQLGAEEIREYRPALLDRTIPSGAIQTLLDQV
jgi:integrase/recombinase XerD